MFDHLAHAPDVNSPSYQLIRRLIDKGNTWVKLSGAYGDTKSGPPEYADRLAVAQGYAQRRAGARGVGQRLAASQPKRQDKKPNDAVLFDLLASFGFLSCAWLGCGRSLPHTTRSGAARA